MATPSILIVPDRYKSGVLYSQLPETGAVDFDVTRATPAFRTNASGVSESVASGVPRLDYPAAGGCPSLLVEPLRTNLALHSRDLANAAWVKTDVTAAKDALGADAVASGATTLTASAASGTVLQTVTAASAERTFSAYVRRVTGTGTIEMTMDNGTTWTAITLTSAYQAVRIPSVTNSNPVIGFRILTSGDAIAVDFTQLEAGAVRTSPIPTTSASVTRNADVISKTGVSGFIGKTEGTLYAEVDIRTFSNFGVFLTISDGNERVEVYKFTDSKIYFDRVSSTQSGTTSVGSNALTAGIFKVAVAYKSGDTTMYINGAQVGTTQTQTFAFSSLTKINIGSNRQDGAQFNDRIRAAAIYTTRLSNTELAALTSL
jgi:hypothetical protein